MNDFLIYTKKKKRGNKKKRAKKIIITLKTSDKWEGGRERERENVCVCVQNFCLFVCCAVAFITYGFFLFVKNI